MLGPGFAVTVGMTVFNPAAPPPVQSRVDALIAEHAASAAQRNGVPTEDVRNVIGAIPEHLDVPADVIQKGSSNPKLANAVTQALDGVATGLGQESERIDSRKFRPERDEYLLAEQRIGDLGAIYRGLSRLPAEEAMKAGNDPAALKRLLDAKEFGTTKRQRMNELIGRAEMLPSTPQLQEAIDIARRARNELPQTETAQTSSQIPSWAGQAVAVLEKALGM